MKKTVVPYETTGYFNETITAYLNGSPALESFYRYPPAIDQFPQIIRERKKFPLYRQVLHDVLEKQFQPYKSTAHAKTVQENFNRLTSENTFTVVTAHQPNLFLGPLYLIYKIISTIRLAARLNHDFPEFHFVPVYWMGSEDHDKAELNHLNLFSKKISWETKQEGAVGRMMTETLSEVMDGIKEVLGQSEEAHRCIELLEKYFLTEPTIAAATTRLLYHLFGAEGLLIVDGDDPALKQLFIPVMKKELFQQNVYPIVSKTSEAFSKLFAPQVAPREINLFYLDDQIRQRIVKEGSTWNVLNTDLSFTEPALLTLLNEHPEKFSPNVVLRPLYQEMVLPNVAFIGGGAEVSYWMLLKAMFEDSGVAFPMLLLRNSVLWIDSGNVSKMNKLGLQATDLFNNTEQLVKDYLLQWSGDMISLQNEKAEINKLMEATLQRVIQFDGSLKGAVEAENVKIQKSLEMLEDKLRRAAKKKEEVSVQQIQNVREKLFPGNSLQERHDNFLMYYLRHGEKFIKTLQEYLDPLQFQFTILEEE